jgi:hypothetical protein
MKAQINKPRYNKYTTLCALVGHHDENGNYCETVFENIKLKDLHKSIAENIYLDHDITLHVAPKCEVRVFAKTMDDIHIYCETIDDLNTRKILLDNYIICTEPTKRYIWTTIDFEEHRALMNGSQV